jgi:hypothetical protein
MDMRFAVKRTKACGVASQRSARRAISAEASTQSRKFQGSVVSRATTEALKYSILLRKMAFLLDTACRVDFALTHSKQTIGVPPTRHSKRGFPCTNSRDLESRRSLSVNRYRSRGFASLSRAQPRDASFWGQWPLVATFYSTFRRLETRLSPITRTPRSFLIDTDPGVQFPPDRQIFGKTIPCCD